MRIAYISSPWFVDCDVPLIGALQNKIDITYIIDVTMSTKNYSMLNIGDINNRIGVYSVNNIVGYENMGRYLDLYKVRMLWHKGSGRWSLIFSQLKLFVFLIKGKYDLIHITWPPNYTSFLLFFFRKKIVLTVHDPLPHSSNVNRMSKFYRQLAFKLFDNFILLNQTQREEFIVTYNMQMKSIFNSRLGVYSHLKDVEPTIPHSKGYVLFFGQISSYKGLDVLCEAMRAVKKDMPTSKLIVAGRGHLYFNINEYVKDGTIEFRNCYISDSELVGLIKYASFVVCPYIDATQSGVIMSSYSLGTPVIVTNVGGLPEMVEFGTYGPVVPAGNVKALSDMIISLLKNNQLLASYKNKICNDYISGKKSWSYISEGMINIYKSIVKNNKVILN